MTRLRTTFFAVSALALLSVAPSAFAADQGYSSWTDPNAAAKAESQVQGIVDELNRLVTQAEKDRAASPGFLRDLRALARRYDNPWQALIVSDAFVDGDFTANPTWSVVSGRWWVERGYGLRSESPAPQAAAAQPDPHPSGKEDRKQAAQQLLGAILNQALGGRQQQQAAPTQAPAPQAGPAVIRLDATITNAFMLQMQVTSWQAEGEWQVGPYQGAAAEAGYRLAYRPGTRPVLELLRVSSRGASIVDSAALATGMEDRNTHKITWSRDAFGSMEVQVDGKAVLKADDRGFRDAFAGLVVQSRGGDVVMSRLDLYGAR